MRPLFDYPPLARVSLGSLALYVWGVFVALGVVLGGLVAASRARSRGLGPQHVWDLAFWLVVAGLLGARLLYVAEYWRDFSDEPWRIFAIWEGGMSAFGAIVFGTVAGLWYARQRRISFLRLAHVVAPALLLGDAIGRLGGAASHMYPGTPTSFPISYVLDDVQRHEVGIELALASFAGFLVVLGVEKLWKKRGEGYTLLSTPALVLLWYSFERFLLDFLRASDLPASDFRYGELTLAQYLSVIGIVVSVILVLRGARPGPPRGGILHV